MGFLITRNRVNTGLFLVFMRNYDFLLRIWGVNIMAEDNKSCRGCVCLTCQYSEQNGDFNRCPFKSCRLCTDTVHHIRSICDKGVQLPKKADYADFVL